MTTNKAQAAAQFLIWRHAEAEDGYPDHARALTKKGHSQAAKLARWLRPRLPENCAILVSPAKRAQQTAEALELPFATDTRLSVHAGARDIVEASAWPGRGRCVLVVGHQPTLGRLAARLLTGSEEDWQVKKGALWWFVEREGETLLRAVIGPDLL